MRTLPSQLQAIINAGGPFTGDTKAQTRLTIDPDWWLNVSSGAAGNMAADMLPIRWYQRDDNSQTEIEIPSQNLKTITISRSLQQVAGTIQVIMYNTVTPALGTAGPNPDMFGDPGYFSYSRGTNAQADARWNYGANSWQNQLRENSLIRCYQGYGPDDMTVEELIDGGYVILDGVFLVDNVQIEGGGGGDSGGSGGGLLTLNGRDMAKLCVDQVVWPPTCPASAYGYDGLVWYTTGQDGVTGTDAWVGVPTGIVSVSSEYPQHDGASMTDGNLDTSWLSAVQTAPTDYQTVSIVTKGSVGGIYITPTTSDVECYVCVQENGKYISGPGPAPDGKIPYVTRFKLGGSYQTTEAGWYKFPTTYQSPNILLEFTNLQPYQTKGPGGSGTYTVVDGDNLTDIAAAEGMSLSALESLNAWIGDGSANPLDSAQIGSGNWNLIYPGQILQLSDDSSITGYVVGIAELHCGYYDGEQPVVGNYSDYVDIVAAFLLWAGFWLYPNSTGGVIDSNVAPTVFGNLESTGAYNSLGPLNGTFNQMAISDAISTITQIVGYIFRADGIGAARFECVDEETEILTQRGWLTHEAIEQGDLVKSFNPETEQTEWVTIKRINSYEVKNEILQSIEGNSHSSLTTSNHRWWTDAGWAQSSDLFEDCIPVVSSDDLDQPFWETLDAEYSYVEYSGTVWCPTLEKNEIWLARRKGTIYFTGNSPNWWSPGNFDDEGNATSVTPILDEKLNLVDYIQTTSDQSMVSSIVVAPEDPYQYGNSPAGSIADGALPIVVRFTPSGIGSLRGIQKPVLFGVPLNVAVPSQDMEIMAELLALQCFFANRQGQATAFYHPAIDLDTQIQIWERTSGEANTHYVTGISITHNCDTGDKLTVYTTYWLGNNDTWVINANADSPLAGSESTVTTYNNDGVVVSQQLIDFLANTGSKKVQAIAPSTATGNFPPASETFS